MEGGHEYRASYGTRIRKRKVRQSSPETGAVSDPFPRARDEVMTLVEAAAVFFPQGSVDAKSPCERRQTSGTLKSRVWQ